MATCSSKPAPTTTPIKALTRSRSRPNALADATATSADRNTRGRLTTGQTINASLDFPTDRDWYRIRFKKANPIASVLSATATTRSSDPLIKIYGADGVELAMDDDGGGNLNSYLEFTAPTTGNYFVEARGFTDDAAGGYTLSAQRWRQSRRRHHRRQRSAPKAIIAKACWRPLAIAIGIVLNSRKAKACASASPRPKRGDALPDPYLVIYGRMAPNSRATTMAATA
jgi:hypothetical protein